MQIVKLAERQSFHFSIVFLFAFATVVLFYFLEQLALYRFLPEGVLIGVVQATSALITALCLISLRRNKINHSLEPSFYFLITGFFCFAIADISWAYLFYVAHIDRKAAISVLLTHIPYGLGYAMSAAAQLNMLRFVSKGRGFRWILLLTVALTTPLYLKFIAFPTYHSAYISGNTFFLVGHVFNTFCCYLLSVVSLAMILSARDLFWSLFAVGSIVLVLENWSFRAELFFFSTPAYGFYDHLWAFGILTCCCPIWIATKRKLSIATPGSYDGKSLVTQTRRSVISLSVLVFILLSFLASPSNQIIRFIAIGCVVAFLLAILFGQYLTEKIEQFATALSSKVTEMMGIPTETERQALPSELKKVFESLFQTKLEEKHATETAQREIASLAANVAHDIRSPLTALNLVISDLDGLSDDNKQLTRAAIGRIGDIANDLLKRGRSKTESSSTAVSNNQAKPIKLWTLIDEIVTEKRLMYRHRLDLQIEVEFQAKAHDFFLQLDPSLLKRVLSNIINNSAEAISGYGKIKIIIALNNSDDPLTPRISIRISDNGKGITPDTLKRLGEERISEGKDNGNGLGLLSASAMIQKMDGTLSIESTIEKGTDVTITLPIVSIEVIQ